MAAEDTPASSETHDENASIKASVKNVAALLGTTTEGARLVISNVFIYMGKNLPVAREL